jgi:hypothetical protein
MPFVTIPKYERGFKNRVGLPLFDVLHLFPHFFKF